HGISTEEERHAFRTISRKVGQSKRDPGPSKLGHHRRLLCSFETFQPAPVTPEGRGLAECDLAAKSCCIGGQQNKSSILRMSIGPPHRISTSLSLGCARASLDVPRRSSRSLSTGVLKCSRRLRATSQASQSLSVSQTTSSDFPPRSKSANARWLFVPRLDGVMFCVASWRCVPFSKTASWRVFASCASPL
ncbi:hypothetical protein TcCL_ESM09582, partial [Trypanosoma cruzi]